jgi:chromate transporter
MIATLLVLAAIFGRLSLLAFGGGNSVLPEMQREVVDVHHWMSATDFTSLFALAQAAPGPNMMVTSLIGYRVAGVWGALVATLGIIVPSSILTLATVSFWHRFRDQPWRKHVQAGLVPVTVGLIAATAAVIVASADSNVLFAGVTAAVAVTLLTTKLHPLWLLGAGAALGVLTALL